MKDEEKESVIIYGCGVNGIHLYYRLKDKYNVLFFVDKSLGKNGYVIDNCECISYDELIKKTRTLKVIVSINDPINVIDELRREGFYNVIEATQIMAYKLDNKSMIDIFGLYKQLDVRLNMQDVTLGGEQEIQGIVDDYHRRRNTSL